MNKYIFCNKSNNNKYIQKGGNNNFRNIISNGNNILHNFCSSGNINEINNILDKNPELIFLSNNDGDTCSHLLVKNANYLIIEKYIKKYPEIIYLLNNNDISFLELINDKNILNNIIKLIESEFINANNISKNIFNNILINAIKNYNYDLVYILVRKNIDLNHNIYDLPLNYVCKINDYELIDILIKGGADINKCDINYKTPLIYAIEYNNIKSLEKLLTYTNLNINYAGEFDNYFCLNIAIKNKNIQIIELLINYKNNLDYNFQDKYLNTPLHNILIQNIKLSSSLIFKLIYLTNIDLLNINKVSCRELLDKNLYSEILKNKKKENNISKINIDIPEIKKNYIGLFNSNIIHIIIYTKLILNKYNNILSIPIKKENELTKDLNNFLLYSKYKSNAGILMKNLIKTYIDTYKNLIPHLIIWYSKHLNYYNNTNNNDISNFINNMKTRFLLFKISIITKYNFTHANILLYDKEKNTLERFEPYGSHILLNDNDLNNYIKLLFKDIKDITFLYPQIYMNNTKFQLISRDSYDDKRKLADPGGYCLAWCFWYIELKMKNPDIDSKILVEKTLENILKKYDILDYIRGYAKKLDEMKNNYLKSINISKNNFYDVEYSDEIINKIKNNI